MHDESSSGGGPPFPDMTTSQPSTADSSQPTLFPGDSRVSHGVQPGSDEARKMTATSGQTCCASYPRYGPLGCLERTLLASLAWGSTVRFLTWSERVTPGRRLFFRLQPWERGTSDNESSLLPTPASQDYGTNQGGSAGRVGKIRPSLGTLARNGLVATATATANQLAPSMMKHKGVRNLLPTPRASDADKGGRGELRSQVNKGRPRGMLPTPDARDWKDNGPLGDPSAHQQTLGRAVIGGPLNPTWVEWLMGFPSGWTDLDASVTPSCPSKSTQSSRQSRDAL